MPDASLAVPSELSVAIGRPRSALVLGSDAGGACAKAKGARVVGVGPRQSREQHPWLDEAIVADVASEAWGKALEGERFDLLVLGDDELFTPGLLARLIPFVEDGGHVVAPRMEGRPPTEAVLADAGLDVLWTHEVPMLGRRVLEAARRTVAAAPAGQSGPPSRLQKAYADWIGPIAGEVAANHRGPLTFGGVVVARRRPERRPQTLTVGMISMNEEGAVGRVIDDIRRHATDAENPPGRQLQGPHPRDRPGSRGAGGPAVSAARLRTGDAPAPVRDPDGRDRDHGLRRHLPGRPHR